MAPVEVTVNVRCKTSRWRWLLFPVLSRALVGLVWLRILREEQAYKLGEGFLLTGMRLQVGNGPWERVVRQ